MSTKHTPEPWHVANNVAVKNAELKTICVLNIHNREANAQRIVECVNAMAGIEDPKKLRETWEICKDLELDKYHVLASDYIRLCRSVKEFINQFEVSIDNLTSDQAIEFGIMKGRFKEYGNKLSDSL